MPLPCLVLITLLASLGTTLLSAVDYETPAAADTRLGELIRRQYRAAKQLRVDGKPGDWRHLTVLQQGEPDRALPPGLDVQAVGVAPVERGLFVMVACLDTMDRFNGSTWLKIDCVDEEDYDFDVGVCFTKDHLVDVTLRGQDDPRVSVQGIEAKQREVLEVFIPWRVLREAIPTSVADIHVWTKDRPLREWVRVRALSWNHRGDASELGDRGIAVACPVLRPEPVGIDHPLREPAADERVLETSFPMRGEWFISQGAFGYFSHGEKWAWDMVGVDSALYRYPILRGEPRCSDYFVYDAELLACGDGEVIRVTDGHPDVPPGETPAGAKANVVHVRLADGSVAQYGHLRAGSIVVSKGQRLRDGDRIGGVGNSGYTTNPHLHFQVVRDGKTMPVAWTRVRVRLNASEQDPWVRHLTAWEPRVGFFVGRGP